MAGGRCGTGRGWVAAGGAGMCSSGPPTRVTATAQTLKAGIRLVGSSAGSVRALALEPPPQWKGAKTTSGRIVSVTWAWNRARPRRVASSTTSSGPMPRLRARSGCSSARAVGATIGEAARAAGLGARLVLRHHPAGRQHVRVLGVGPLVGVDVLDAQEPGAAVGGGEPLGEQPRGAGVVGRRAGPEDAVLGVDAVVADAGVVGGAAGAGPAQLLEDGLGLGAELVAGAEPGGEVGQQPQVVVHAGRAGPGRGAGGSPGPRGWSSCPPPPPTWRWAGRRRRARRSRRGRSR